MNDPNICRSGARDREMSRCVGLCVPWRRRAAVAEACLFAAGLFGAVAAAQAVEPLADPTRPPVAVYSGSGELIDDSRRLTSVLRPRVGDPVAVIGGAVVPLGGRVGNARLVRIDESGALLAGPDGQEELLMTPEVSKTSRQETQTKAATRPGGEWRKTAGNDGESQEMAGNNGK